ncbi:DNA cytosine methyltransferase [Aliisedimentitalea scapharcae]|uniref:DNA (cytosine-5-)-methyltransferase n=1 Tax=Aliisedimentitalea scapharcae TaxID=1524259 RepID=A0ABZ2XUQ0_9RHOB
MAARPKNGLSLCAGGGGLDMGLMLAEPGFHTRCFVEWEEHPRKTLIAAQRAGYLAPAPIWDDVTTFDARPFAGAFDTLLAGYPCQPFSAAGQRKGEDDERHLWPDIERIIGELGPDLEWCFFENVRGHVSLGLETVLRSLRKLGFAVGAGIFSAQEVGAPHERQRIFIVAHREGRDRGGEQQSESARRGRAGFAGGGAELGNYESIRRGKGRPEPEFWSGGDASTGAGGQLAHTDGGNASAERQQRSGKQRFQRAGGRIGYGDPPATELAHTGGARTPPWSAKPKRKQQGFAVESLDYSRPIFPPGPGATADWQTVLEGPNSDLAPAVGVDEILARALRSETLVQEPSKETLEPVVRRMANGLAARSRALRLLGNGVCPLVAAYAWRTLSSAHGLRVLDLGATYAHPDHTSSREPV